MGIRDWFRGTRSAADREIETEIEFHIDGATAENLAKGMPPPAARAEAIRRFGDLARVRRECLAARGRTVPRPVAWVAVAALAAVSFLAGFGLRERPLRTFFSSSSPERLRDVVVANWDISTLRTVPYLRGKVVPATVLISAPRNSPFAAWRWRDGVPEVSLDGKGWFELVSAAGIPGARLREEYRKVWGLPEGTYRDGDPYLVITASEACRGPSVDVVLRSLSDGTEVRVACSPPTRLVEKEKGEK